ncbi:MAG: TonB-dependent receptor plug domain-containing protein [Gemmatimonadales bacterium]
MKKSLSSFLPAALVIGALGCAQGHKGASLPMPSRPALGLTWEDIDRSPGVPIEQLLAARVPGITIARASDGRMVMFLRGQSTLNEPLEPLFVVNGIPLGNAANLSAINRNDIASIEVLRDAASTAMYGLLGSGGVILIKTKGS